MAEAGYDEVYRIIVFEARAPRKAPLVPKLMELAERSVGIAGGIDDVVAAERYLVGQLGRLDEEVVAIEERIIQTLAMVPEGEIICSFPAAKEMRAAPSSAPWAPRPAPSIRTRPCVDTSAGRSRRSAPAPAWPRSAWLGRATVTAGARCACGPSG